MATVAALEAGAPFAAAQAALARFAGVTRRFEFRGEVNEVTFVDDYAHLPGEVRVALATARTGGWQRMVAVFQPHRFSRTAALAEQFGTAFEQADELVVTDIYSAGERPVPGVSGRLVADAVRAQDPRLPVAYAPGWEELRRTVASILRPGDLCLTLGAGDLTTLPDELLGVPSGDAGYGAPGTGRGARARATLLAPLGPLTTYGVGGPAAVLGRGGRAGRPRRACAPRCRDVEPRRVRDRPRLEPARVRRGLRRRRAPPRRRASPELDAARRRPPATAPRRRAWSPAGAAVALPSWPGGWRTPVGRGCRGRWGCRAPWAGRCG